METINISGRLYKDAEQCVDRNGKTYTRIIVTCGASVPDGRSRFTHYRCTCYQRGYENLKKHEQVFITGSLAVTTSKDDRGSFYVNLDVVVYQIARGKKD